MKKYLLSILLISAGSLSLSAVDWTTTTNLVVNSADNIVVSSNPDNRGLVVDNNDGTRWQATPAKNLGEGVHNWFYIDLGQSQTFNIVEVVWEASSAAKYNIYVSDQAPTYTTVETNNYNVIDDSWFTDRTYTEATTTGAGTVTTLAETDWTGQYILIYETEESANSANYGMSPFEIRVGYLVVDKDTPTELKVDNVTIVSGASADLAWRLYNNLGTEITDKTGWTISVDNPPVSDIVLTNNTITATTMGVYTLTLKAQNGDNVLTADFVLSVTYDWGENYSKNVAVGKSSYASHNTGATGDSVDGNTGTRWGVGEDTRTNTWYYVDLGDVYSVEAIGVIWETAYCSDYKYYTATEADTDGNPVWSELTHIQQTLSAANNYCDTYVPATAVNARYIKLECIQSEIWGMSFYEFLVNGTFSGTHVATTLEVTGIKPFNFTDETASVCVKDQLGEVMADAEISLTSDKGLVTLQNGVIYFEKFGSDHITITSGTLSQSFDINIATANANYVSTENATVTLNGTKVDETATAALATQTTDNWFIITDQGTQASNTLRIELPQNADVNAVKIRWERACATAYTISIATALGTDSELSNPTTKSYSQSVPDTDTDDSLENRIVFSNFSSIQTNDLGVKYIELKTTAVSEWGAKIKQFTLYSDQSIQTGVESITINPDENMPIEYYNLNGVRVNGDLTPGIYIRRQGNVATKVLVK